MTQNVNQTIAALQLLLGGYNANQIAWLITKATSGEVLGVTGPTGYGAASSVAAAQDILVQMDQECLSANPIVLDLIRKGGPHHTPQMTGITLVKASLERIRSQANTLGYLLRSASRDKEFPE